MIDKLIENSFFLPISTSKCKARKKIEFNFTPLRLPRAKDEEQN